MSRAFQKCLTSHILLQAYQIIIENIEIIDYMFKVTFYKPKDEEKVKLSDAQMFQGPGINRSRDQRSIDPGTRDLQIQGPETYRSRDQRSIDPGTRDQQIQGPEINRSRDQGSIDPGPKDLQILGPEINRSRDQRSMDPGPRDQQIQGLGINRSRAQGSIGLGTRDQQIQGPEIIRSRDQESIDPGPKYKQTHCDFAPSEEFNRHSIYTAEINIYHINIIFGLKLCAALKM